MARDHLYEQQCEAMLKHAEDRSVTILIEDDDHKPVDRLSGMCVQIGRRYFIATVAHLVKRVPKERIAVLAWRGEADMAPKLLDKGWRGGEDNDPTDIAWLEIGAKAVEILPRLWTTLDRFDVRAPPIGTEVYVYGSPLETSKPFVATDGRAGATFGPVGFNTVTTARTKGAKRPADWTYDVFLEYPEQTKRDLPSHWGKKVPDADGMSGCGIWAFNWGSPGLWTPESSRVVAVQGSWHGGERWLRGTLIRHWLEMVRENIPALAPEIDPVLNGEPSVIIA